MIEALAERIVTKHIEAGDIEAVDEEIYKYGYILALETGVNITLGITIGIWLDSLSTVLLFWAVYIPLRTYGGGWHAPKMWLCTFLSNIILVAIILTIGIWKTGSYDWRQIVVETGCVIIIMLLCPVDTKAKRLTQACKFSYKKKVIGIICAEELLSITIPMLREIIYAAYIIMTASLLVQTCINRLDME